MKADREFRKIAGRFVLGGSKFNLKEYVGDVIASKDAFFLKGETTTSGLGAAIGGAFGAAGHMAAQALSKPSTNSESPFLFSVEELPESISMHPDWRLKDNSGNIFIIPKKSVTSIRYPWYSKLEIKCDEDVFKIAPNFFQRNSILRFLRNKDWQL